MPRPVSNPPNPWRTVEVEWLGPPPDAELEVFEETARSALTRNDSPDIPFTWSVNPYRGCHHACAYCYARTTHQYLDWGAGTDFDRKLVVKVNVPELLRAELAQKSWKREVICFSGVTDCYQALEAHWRLTQQCLQACLERRTPVTVITKAALVRRDAELLAELNRRAGATVYLSIPFADNETARKVEPGASSPSQRFETLRALSEAGVETGVSISPVIPGLNESDVPRILERAAEAGASRAFLTLLRLSAEVRPVFEERMRIAFPERAERIRKAQTRARLGQRSGSDFGARMQGAGPRWDMVRQVFELHCRRLGLNSDSVQGPRGPQPKQANEPGRQGELFG